MQRARRKDRKCRRCKTVKPIQLFEGNSAICRSCKERARYFKENRTYDWAHALIKSVKMHIGKHNGKLGQWRSSLTEGKLRAIMKYQGGKCAISRIQLCYPGNDIAFEPKATMKTWLETLTPEELSRSPVLVRPNNSGDWVAGNVIFIAQCLVPFHAAMGDLYRLREVAEVMARPAPVIPQPEDLRKQTRKDKK